jgi:SAM-dependent methyltransferase
VRQKWSALWPHLETLPPSGLRVLDAGSARGDWTLELAARRPGWRLVGLDREESQRRIAESSAAALGLRNVEWVTRDFFAFDPGPEFDVVLSVASAHYAATQGRGEELFARFRSWTRPGGLLVLLVPRREEEVPFWRGLSRPGWHPVFGGEALLTHCGRSGWEVETLRGVVGGIGMLAKQLDWTVAESLGPAHALLQAVPLLVSSLERLGRPRSPRRSAFWALVARTA